MIDLREEHLEMEKVDLSRDQIQQHSTLHRLRFVFLTCHDAEEIWQAGTWCVYDCAGFSDVFSGRCEASHSLRRISSFRHVAMRTDLLLRGEEIHRWTRAASVGQLR